MKNGRKHQMRQVMKLFLHVSLACCLLLCPSCFTEALWESTNPNERIWMDSTSITAEELTARGIAFDVYETKEGRGFLVEKSSWRKLGDYHLRLLVTPVTLVLDTATTVLVVGVYMFYLDPEGTCYLIDALCD